MKRTKRPTTTRSMTPLWVISLFVALTELVAGIAVSQADGGIQIALTAFVIAFPLLVAGGFFAVLWHRPYVFYPPTDFGEPDVEKFVGAMRPLAAKSETLDLVQEVASTAALVQEAVLQKDDLGEERTETVVEVKAVGDGDGQPEVRSEVFWLKLLSNKDYDGALAALQRDIEVAADEDEKLQLKSFVGHVILSKGDSAAAVAHYENLLTEAPDKLYPYWWYGLSLYWNDKYVEAIAIFDRGLARGTVRAAPLLAAKADALRALGRTNEAIRAFEAAIADDPTNPEFYDDLATILASREDYDRAANWYRAGLSANPKSERLLMNFAKHLAGHGAPQEALALYTTLTDTFPTNQNYHTLLANTLLDLEMYDLALEHYLTANKLAEGKEAWIVANIGNIYNGRGFHSQAIRHLREAITLDPESQYAYERLGRALKSQSQQIEARRELLSKAKATLAAQTEQAALPAGQPSQETPR